MTQQIDVNQLADALNAKVDLDGTWGFPSHTYDELTLGASGTTYTAPENGYFVVDKASGAADKYLNMINTTTGLAIETNCYAATNNLKVWLPVRAGDVVSVGYSLTGATNFFRFIYAQKTN